MAATAQTAMDRAKITSDEVDWVVPHQANIRIIQGTAKKMGVPDERVENGTESRKYIGGIDSTCPLCRGQ